MDYKDLSNFAAKVECQNIFQLLKCCGFSIAAAMELFQGQEVSPILTLENCTIDCTYSMLTSPSYVYCQNIGGSHQNAVTGIDTILPFLSLSLGEFST